MAVSMIFLYLPENPILCKHPPYPPRIYPRSAEEAHPIV